MTTRTRLLASTAALLAVAAGAVLFARYGIAGRDDAVAARKATEAKLYAFAPADVVAVTVEAKGEVTHLVRSGDRWTIDSPLQADAERAAVDALVDRLAALSRSSAIADTADADALTRYGLAKPRARVSLTLKRGTTETLSLGDENPFDGTAFVRSTGGAIALVPGDLRWAVERGTLDLREKRLLPFDEDDLERVEVAAPTMTYGLARDGTGRWQLDAPVKEPADENTAGRVIGAIRGLRATGFEPAGGRDPAAPPRWRVTLVEKGGRRRVLAVFVPQPAATGPAASLRARVEGSAEMAAIPAEATRDLDQTLFALRDKTVLRFDRDRVAALRFDRGGSPFEVRRDAAPGKLAGYVWTLASLKAKAFADDTGRRLFEHGLDRPELQIALLGSDGNELGRLLVSAARDGRTFAKASDRTRIVEIDPAALDQLPRDAKQAAETRVAGPQANAAPKPK